MTFMIQVFPMLLILVIAIVMMVIGSVRNKKLSAATPNKSEGKTGALSAAAAVVKKNKGSIGAISILTTLYAGFLSLKKNKGLTLNGALASVFSPQLYIVMMLSTAKKFSLNSFLGKGEWKKCLSMGLPWWYWLFFVLAVLPIALFAAMLASIRYTLT
jgi:hypothetical protein